MKMIVGLVLGCLAVLMMQAEVVVPDDAPSVQKRAGRELEKYIGKILGADKKYPRIVLGTAHQAHDQ